MVKNQNLEISYIDRSATKSSQQALIYCLCLLNSDSSSGCLFLVNT